MFRFMMSLHGCEFLGDFNVGERWPTEAFKCCASFLIFASRYQPSRRLRAELNKNGHDRRHRHKDDEWDLIAEAISIILRKASDNIRERHSNDDNYQSVNAKGEIILMAYKPKPTPRRLAGSDSTMYICAIVMKIPFEIPRIIRATYKAPRLVVEIMIAPEVIQVIAAICIPRLLPK